MTVPGRLAALPLPVTAEEVRAAPGLAAADALYDNYANYGIRNVLANPERLPHITSELDRALGF